MSLNASKLQVITPVGPGKLYFFETWGTRSSTKSTDKFKLKITTSN